MRTNEELERQTLALFETRRLERTRDYAQRGRRFAGMSDAEALANWRRAFVTWSRDPFDTAAQRAEEDAMAELDLRGVDPDYESVRGSFEQAMSTMRAASAEAKKDRKRWLQIGADMLADLDEHERSQAVLRARPN